MSRRPFIHVLLALLLLFTQQLGATHVYSHWAAIQQSFTGATLGETESAEHRKRIAVDKICAECVSVAHLAVFVVTPPSSVMLLAAGSRAVTTPPTLSACERTVCVFQPRAPPLA